MGVTLGSYKTFFADCWAKWKDFEDFIKYLMILFFAKKKGLAKILSL